VISVINIFSLLILKKEAELRLFRQTALLVVRDYNKIILSLPVAHRDIFRMQLRMLDSLLTKVCCRLIE
jgi:hypothetical protein